MEKVVVFTEQAASPAGPYSQAIRVGDLVFTAGQLPLVPGTKDVAGPDIASQTRQALENVRAILEAGGSCLEHTVKCTVFLSDIGEFSDMNKVYAEFFPQNAPARSTVPIGALPAGMRIQIEAVGLVCECGPDCGASD
jgi:2-iminobutanoate/2-iminopropanoate deaminase